MIKKLLLAGFVLSVMAVTAFAGPCSTGANAQTCYADVIGGLTFPAAGGTPLAGQLNLNDNIMFPKFDTSLGTLTGVELDFTGALSGQVDVVSSGASNANYHFAESADITFTLPGSTCSINCVFTLTSFSVPAAANVRLGPCSSNCVIDPLSPLDRGTYASGVVNGDTVSFYDGLSSSGSLTVTDATDPAFLTAFDGPSGQFVSVPVTASSTFTSTTSSISQHEFTYGQVNATVIYTFTQDQAPTDGSVPEPSTMLLLGSLLPAIGVLRKRMIG